jgi:lysophospholipase L1-like esterase
VYVLNSAETAIARQTVAAYNNIIQTTASEHGLAYVDANSFLKGITKGAYYDGISTSASFLSGGAFSLDGVHLTPRGNALAANEFIKAMNAKYGTKITVVNPGQYRGVTFP